MKTIKLSLSTKYCPDWGVWEGCREILQNAKDAETEHGAKMAVDYDSLSETLTVTNAGASISTSSLLIGESSKRGKENLIGQFGEGMKIGILALLRCGKAVTIYTGRERWFPALVDDEEFGQKVLSFGILPQETNDVTVSISPVSSEEWASIKARIRWLDPAYDPNNAFIPDEPGNIYSNGIFVMNDPNLGLGYDIPLALDRDRKLASSIDIYNNIASRWMSKLSNAPTQENFLAFTALAKSNKEDTKFCLYTYSSYEVARKYLDLYFTPRYGKDAVAVSNHEDETLVSAWGGLPVVVPHSLSSFIRRASGSVSDWALKRAQCIDKIYAHEELSTYEQASLSLALELIGKSAEEHVKRVRVVDFSRGTLRGLHHAPSEDNIKGYISIARSQLYSLANAVEVLLHEFAHDKGIDGSLPHVQEIQEQAAKLIIQAHERRKA